MRTRHRSAKCRFHTDLREIVPKHFRLLLNLLRFVAVGFARPTTGTAYVEGFNIISDMDRIYTLMGVCPQVTRHHTLAVGL